MVKRLVNPLPGQPRKVKEPWVEEYEKAFWRYLSTADSRKMQVVPEAHRDDAFSWGDEIKSREFRHHMRGCEVNRNETPMPTDDLWEEFAGTFTENDRIHGLQAQVTCKCNRWRRVKVRYRGTMSDLILGVLNAASVGGGEEEDR